MSNATLYITTNLVNNKKYIGQTTSKNTKYIGSGTAIKAAIKKYGRKQFVREDIYNGDWELIDLMEFELINKLNAINSTKFYNLKEGGYSGKHNNSITSNKIRAAKLGTKASIETRKKMSKAHSGENNSFYGKIHTEESKNKIKKAREKQIITEESNQKRSTALTGLVRKISTCPHCGKSGRGGNMKRYHYDNCKNK